jgi:hypothetical protein
MEKKGGGKSVGVELLLDRHPHGLRRCGYPPASSKGRGELRSFFVAQWGGREVL